MKKLFSLLLLFSFLFSSEDYNDLFREGESLFKATCATCHGLDGNSNTGLELVVKPRKLSKTILNKKQVREIVLRGANFYGAHSDIMPSFKMVLNDRQVDAITLYVEESFLKKRAIDVDSMILNAKSIKSDLKKGKKIFNRNCSLCHGIKGDAHSEYVEMSKASDKFIYPYDLQKILLDEEQIFLFIKYGGKYWGTYKNDMPSWKKKYNDVELKSVAKYINEVIKKN